MQLVVKVGDLLEETADAILASANPWLAMSGGVGGAILQRGNGAVQQELRTYLHTLGQPSVPPGTVVATGAGNLAARVLLHGVAVDAFYQSSPDVIARTVRRALEMAAERGGSSVALCALATGFGALSLEDFARGLAQVLAAPVAGIERVVLVVRRDEDRVAVERVLTPRA